jgi:hypothetical protein
VPVVRVEAGDKHSSVHREASFSCFPSSTSSTLGVALRVCVHKSGGTSQEEISLLFWYDNESKQWVDHAR